MLRDACVCVCVCGEHNQNCHCPEDSGLILPLSCVVMSSRYATWPLWFWASSPSPCPMPVWLALLPPLPPHPASRVSSAHGHSCRPSSPCLPRWTFNAVGEFGMDTKNHRPLTVPRGSLRRRQERAKEEKKNEQRGKVAAWKSGDENRRTQPRRTQKWHSVSTVPEDLRSQSTFIAVAGLDCVEKLTEQWVQLWPRSAWLASQPISRPDVRHSDYFIYILLVFHFYFLPPSSLPGAGSLKGKEKER